MTAELQQAVSRELVIDEQDEQKAVVLMDRLDLDQAMAELRGEVVERFVYTVPGGYDKKNNRKFPDKRQLSYAGVREAARLYKNVHFGATAQQLADGSWVLTPFAHNIADNLSCSLPLPYPAFNPASAQESINYRASLSKSIRMALAAVLPITYIEAMISRWSEQQGGPAPQALPARSTPAQQARNITPAQPGQASPPAVDPQLALLRTERERLVAKYPDAAPALKYPDAKLPDVVARLQRRERLEDPASWVTEAAALLERYGAEVSPTQPAEVERCRAVIDAGRRLLPDVVPVAAKDMAPTILIEYLENLYDAAQVTYPALFEELPAAPAPGDDEPF